MKIAILGYGIEGKSTYAYLKELNPKYEIDVYDEADITDNEVKITKVKNMLDIDFAPYGVIVRSPSILPDTIVEKIIADKNGSRDFNLTSNTQMFFDKCPAPIIGITGTKGKGSTASFINEILKSTGATTHLVGNIGIPALDALPEVKQGDIIVYELSSFQLSDFKRKSPHVAVITMIEPDHMDVHSDMDEYIGAKSNIVKNQTEDDFVVYYEKDKLVSEIAKSSKAKKIPYPDTEVEKQARASVKLIGEHQILNAQAAILAVKAINPNITDEQIAKGLAGFEGLPHRLKLVREKNGVKYYDDSIATTPGSAIASVKSFKEPKILLLGGKDKGADYSELASEIVSSNVKTVIVYGANRDRIIDALRNQNFDNIVEVDSKNISDIVQKSAEIAEPGDVVVLSPAAASFDMFKSYSDRGEQFVTAINNL